MQSDVSGRWRVDEKRRRKWFWIFLKSVLSERSLLVRRCHIRGDGIGWDGEDVVYTGAAKCSAVERHTLGLVLVCS